MRWATETKLWKAIRCEGMTRIESGGTHEGIADVEYVLPPWHGWLELKITYWPRKPRDPFYLQSPYTLMQAIWLLKHQRPTEHLRSWLLLGVGDTTGSRWSAFILIPPKVALRLMEGRKPPGHMVLLKLPGVRLDTRQSLIDYLKGKGKPS